jgi:hypothetical protein
MLQLYDPFNKDESITALKARASLVLADDIDILWSVGHKMTTGVPSSQTIDLPYNKKQAKRKKPLFLLLFLVFFPIVFMDSFLYAASNMLDVTTPLTNLAQTILREC